jgi:hypothetical protein
MSGNGVIAGAATTNVTTTVTTGQKEKKKTPQIPKNTMGEVKDLQERTKH